MAFGFITMCTLNMNTRKSYRLYPCSCWWDFFVFIQDVDFNSTWFIFFPSLSDLKRKSNWNKSLSCMNVPKVLKWDCESLWFVSQEVLNREGAWMPNFLRRACLYFMLYNHGLICQFQFTGCDNKTCTPSGIYYTKLLHRFIFKTPSDTPFRLHLRPFTTWVLEGDLWWGSYTEKGPLNGASERSLIKLTGPNTYVIGCVHFMKVPFSSY